MQCRFACLAATTILLTSGSASARQTQGGASRAYVLPGAISPVLPTAYPPGDRSSFSRDIDFPEPDHYQQEVIRVVEGGFFPATVTQLAVISPGQPVQVLVLHAQRRETLLIDPPHVPISAKWVVTSRKFGSMSWTSFYQLRHSVLECIIGTAAKARAHDRDVRTLQFGCTDDGGGSLAYVSARVSPFTASLSGCENDAVRKLKQRVMIMAATLTGGAQEALP